MNKLNPTSKRKAITSTTEEINRIVSNIEHINEILKTDSLKTCTKLTIFISTAKNRLVQSQDSERRKRRGKLTKVRKTMT